jgi:flagellar P-ring protein FlgI
LAVLNRFCEREVATLETGKREYRMSNKECPMLRAKTGAASGQRRLLGLAVALALIAQTASPCRAGVRIKDITDLQGARANQLVGFGLVVGLDGTGSKSAFTQQVAVDMLQRFNVTAKIIAGAQGDAVFKSGNISAVMLTAEIGPFARKGSKIDVIVAAIDDAASLQGGILLQTPLRGADNVDYAIAQGPLSVGG